MPVTPTTLSPFPVTPLPARAENDAPVSNGIAMVGNLRSLSNVSETRSADAKTIKKNVPYYSKKRDGNIDLNCKVNSNDDENEQIVCRHLASYWQEQFIQGGGKVDYSHLATPDAIRSNISAEKYHRAALLPGVISLAENQEWGRVILDMFRDMQKKGDALRDIGIYTTEHAMALGLKIKSAPEGKRWVIQFYDPNHTATHQRAEYAADGQEEIKQLTAGDFLDNLDLVLYDLSVGGVTEFIDRHHSGGVSTTKHLPDNVLQLQVIYHVLTWGLTDTLQQIATKLKASSLASAEKEALLAAKRGDGVPGLYMALENGHADSVRAYGDIILQAGLELALTMSLLAAKQGDGVPGLYMALENGHADSVREYGDIVLKAGLEPALTMGLLAARTWDDAPGLNMALQNGHAESVRAYGDIVLKAGLEPARTMALLAAKRGDGVPGLYMALENGHAESVRAYGDIVLKAGFEPTRTMALLAAKRKDGVPGLLMALESGHADSVREYGDIVLKAGLEPALTMGLLAAKDWGGTPALFMALHCGQAEAVRAYGDIVLQAGLEPALIMALLAAKGDNGVSGLYWAHKNGNADAVRAFNNIVLQAGLGSAFIETLFRLNQ
ncbi:ShET2/EspL2 family type III secretion system effector toxin [Enterobacter ludwigii]